MRCLQLESIFDGYSSKADGSFGLRFTTSLEVDGDTVKDIHSFKKKLGWLLFAENEIQDSDIPPEPARGEGKSQSKRLYDVLYVWYLDCFKKGDTRDDFNTFYHNKMEKIIEYYKSKLPPR